MPLLASTHKQSFDPDTIDLLGRTLDSAWNLLLNEGLVGANAQEARSALAKQLIELAHRGERDPRRLLQVALDRFLHAGPAV